MGKPTVWYETIDCGIDREIYEVRIENGRITTPVAEFTIAGNLRDMYRRLTPANDLEFRYGTNVPTLRIDGMTVAGG